MSIRLSGDQYLWPSGVIPFTIDSVDFPQGSVGNSSILAAIAEWNGKTNITFVPRLNEDDYVNFRLGDAEMASSSHIGRKGGKQDINGASLGFTATPVIHEIGHAVGLFHEQSREDRDSFVNINLSAVLSGTESDFEKEDGKGDDIGPYDYLSIMHYGRKFYSNNVNVDTVIPVSWFGFETQAAGIAAADVAHSGSANDVVIFHIDNADGANTAYYRVIFGLKKDGTDGGMSNLIQVPGWFGSENQGGGVAIADISRSGLPDILIFFIDNPDGENHGYYRIGWDMDKTGQVKSWSDPIEVDGWFGSSTSGAGVALAKLNANSNWDLVIFHIDNPDGGNTGYYRVGFDLGDDGKARRWLPPSSIPGWWGNDTAAAGVTVGSVGGVNTIITFHVDDPDGANAGYLRLGQLQNSGNVINWTNPVNIPGWFGNDTQDGDVAIINFAGSLALLALHIDNPDGENRGYFRVGTNLTVNGQSLSWSNIIPVHNFGADAINVIGNQSGLSLLDIKAVNTMYPAKTVYGSVVKAGGWFGTETEGADVALADINGNGQQDMVLFFVDNPGGANTGFYRIGWDLDASGLVTGGFTTAIPIPGWWGNETAGGGVAIADISGNGRPDIVVMHIDNPGGANQGYYRIGRDLDINGVVKGGWTAPIPIPGWFGDTTGDAGVALADITGTGQLDLVVFHIDDPDGKNQGYYRIGKDINASGTVTSWTPLVPIPGWFGNETQGAGIAIKDLTGNGKPDLVIFNIDNPDGANHGYYRVGRDLDRFGNVTGGWTRAIEIAGWFGSENADGGLAIADINGDGVNDFLVFHIDNPDGNNYGYYRTIFAPLLS